MAGVREVEYGDLEAGRRVGTAGGGRAPPEGDWRWLGEENPAAQRSGVSRGWVLVEGDAVVGFLGNIPQECQLGDRGLIASIARGLVVAPAFRGSSLQLLLT